MTNLKAVTILTTAFFLSGCISIKTPENLVSDTIQAGKDVYHSFADEEENESIVENNNEGNETEVVEVEILDAGTTQDETETQGESQTYSETTFSSENIFTASYSVAETSSFTESSAKCIDLAIENARKSTNVYNINIVNSSAKYSKIDGHKSIECEIKLKN